MRCLDIGSADKAVAPREGETWDRLDVTQPATIVCDLSQPPYPIKSATYDYAYMGHVLEHLPWETAAAVLSEIRRIIKTGGQFDVLVPDFDKIIAGYHNEREMLQDKMFKCKYHKEKTGFARTNRNKMRWVNSRVFAYGDETMRHRAMYTYDYLHGLLIETGFTSAYRIDECRGHDHGWITLGVRAVV